MQVGAYAHAVEQRRGVVRSIVVAVAVALQTVEERELQLLGLVREFEVVVYAQSLLLVQFGLSVGSVVVDDGEEAVRLRRLQRELVHQSEVEADALVVVECELPHVAALHVHRFRRVDAGSRVVAVERSLGVDVLVVRSGKAQHNLLAQPHAVVVVRSGMTVRVAQQRVAHVYMQRVDGVAVAERAHEVGHGGVVCEGDVHVAHAAHLPLQEDRRLVRVACAHGCGVERSVVIVDLLATVVPFEHRHNHQRLHRRDGRFHGQLVRPFVRQSARCVRRVSRCRRAVSYVQLVGVAEEVACDACAA